MCPFVPFMAELWGRESNAILIDFFSVSGGDGVFFSGGDGVEWKFWWWGGGAFLLTCGNGFCVNKSFFLSGGDKWRANAKQNPDQRAGTGKSS